MNRKQQRRIRRFQGMVKYYPSQYNSIARDNFRCRSCGSANIDKLQVHHIDKNRLNNGLSNLITLCKRCHAKWHGITYIERPEVIEMRESGMTFAEIGKHLGVTSQRAHQIYVREIRA